MSTRGAGLLRAWRKVEGLTQFQAAVRLGFDPTQLSRWERGGCPALKNALKLEQEAGIPAAAWDEVATDEASVIERDTQPMSESEIEASLSVGGPEVV